MVKQRAPVRGMMPEAAAVVTTGRVRQAWKSAFAV
jgi:hypothetical protein